MNCVLFKIVQCQTIMITRLNMIISKNNTDCLRSILLCLAVMNEDRMLVYGQTLHQ